MSVKPYAFGLIGWPLAHSLSPLIHGAAMDAAKLEGTYRLHPVPPLPEGASNLARTMGSLRRAEIDGLNVTRPHKQTVLNHLDRLSPTAAAIGAANTIRSENGALVGHNTDKDGFVRDLDATLSLDAGEALVLGAGGAARAVVLGLCERNWRVYVASRRLDQAQGLAGSMNQSGRDTIAAIPLAPEALMSVAPGCTLIVNATPLGMPPDSDLSAWPLEVPFPSGVAVYDLVYTSPETRLTQSASRAGLPAVTGLGMLIEQAALAFELWTGCPASRPAMRRVVQSAGYQRMRE